MKEHEIQMAEYLLREEIKKKLPIFAAVKISDGGHITIHQDAFAADYQDEEYALLGRFIKYVGLQGKEIHIIGKNRETIK